MKFDFNKNINESVMDRNKYYSLLQYYTKHKKYKELETLRRVYSKYFENEEQPANSTESISQQKKSQISKNIKKTENNNSLNFQYNIDDQKFNVALDNVKNIHNQILDMYVNTLYEDNWDETTIEKFDSLMDEYNKDYEYIKTNISNIAWKSESEKAQFMKYFKEVIEADVRSWNRVQVRNNNYLRYRTNRKSIILQICDVLGGLKSSKDVDYLGIFKYFNNKCANIKLYDNSDIKEKKDYLAAWFKPHLNEIIDGLRDSVFMATQSIDAKDVSDVFRVYVKCRKLAYSIFNLMTSNSNVQGYTRWHTKIVDYCDASLNNNQIQQLIYAVDSENQFEEVDDYHNIMDEKSWEIKGYNESMGFNYEKDINESWFDDSLEYYQSHKDRYNKSKIGKINMIPTNANQCRVQCDGEYVYSNAKFYPGDIIEICPTKNIDKSSLYSKDMRDSVFEVIPNKQWVLPFGYCRYYLHDVPEEETNCTYIWDPIKKVIVIKATRKIEKNEKLLLNCFT